MTRIRDILPSVFLAFCILLGGSSSGGAVANACVKLFGVAAIIFVLATVRPLPMIRSERLLMLIGALFVAIGVVQLIPLPAGVWTHLAGRDEAAKGFVLLGQSVPAMPLSMWPIATLSVLTALIAPLAMVLLVATTGPSGLRYIAWTVGAMAALSFFVGIAQLAGGSGSLLYFYRLTNMGQTVGFFANSNHLATFGVMTLPFIAALSARDGDSKDSGLHRRAGKWAALACLAAFIVLGVFADGSMAGIGLLLPALGGSFLILRAERARIAIPAIVALVGVVVVAFALIAFNSPLINGFGATDFGTGAGSRAEIFSNTIAAIRAYFPFGSGLGSFLLVYPLYDQAAPATSVFVNHAHGDYLELLLETGLPGAALLVVFVLWYLRRTLFAWRDGGYRARFAKAATVSAGLLMIHSLVDYPIRTAALAVLFAACCAMMAKPLPSSQAKVFRGAKRPSEGKHLEVE